jgi:hypothetical protein
MWQNVSEKGPFFATTFFRPFKDQSGTWRNGTSFGLNDLEALNRFNGKPSSSGASSVRRSRIDNFLLGA